MTAFKRMYEHAGLYAYQETFDHAAAWNEQRGQQETAAAIQNLPPTADESSEANQVAIYDPEFRQWHFVPFGVLAEEQSE